MICNFGQVLTRRDQPDSVSDSVVLWREAPPRRNLQILIPSIVNPAVHTGGAGAVTRGLLRLLADPPIAAETTVIAPESPLPHSVRQAAALARSAVSSLPSKALFVSTHSFCRRVASALERRPDLVLLNGSDLLWLATRLPSEIPVVLYSHNLEHELYRSQLDRMPRWSAPLRPLLRRDLASLASFERKGMSRVGHVLFISAEDDMAARAEDPALHTLHLPPVFAYQRTPRRQVRGSTPRELPELAMLANFTWWPNLDAFVWLRDRVLPRVRRDLRVHLIGQGSERLLGDDPRLQAHGWVPDTGALLARCDAMLCATVSGAGVNVKFAEALYNGIPVLATPLAMRGLAFPRIFDHSLSGLGFTPESGLALVDGADAWACFLDGPGLDTLCRARIPPELANAFTPDYHREAVTAFLAGILSGERDGLATDRKVQRFRRHGVPTCS